MLPALWEIVIPLILAVLLGIFIGWLMWRWRRAVISETEWIITRERAKSLEADLATAERERTAADTARIQAFADLDVARQGTQAVEADLGTARAEIEALTEAKDQAESRIGELDTELAGVRGEADELTGKLSSLTTDLDAARADIDAANRAADAARADADAAKVAAAADIDAAKAAAVADADAAKVAALADLDVVRGEADSARAVTADLQAQLDAARAEVAAAQADADAARSAAAAAQANAGDQGAIIAGLEADLAACRATVADLGAADDPAVNWQQGVTTLGTPGAAHRDDLKVVNGIGPKMEGLLNGFGIQSWEQLAWLTPDQVQTVDDALEDFPGRIERDEWVPQAKDLIQRFPDRADRPTRETFLNRSEA